MLAEFRSDSLLSEMEQLKIYGGSGNPKEFLPNDGCSSNTDCTGNSGCNGNTSCNHNDSCIGHNKCSDLIMQYKKC